jgi:hypothetical protein
MAWIKGLFGVSRHRGRVGFPVSQEGRKREPVPTVAVRAVVTARGGRGRCTSADGRRGEGAA